MTVAAIIQLLGPGVLAVGVWSPEEWPGAGALSMIAHNKGCRLSGRRLNLCGDMPHVGATAAAVESLAVLPP